MYYDKRLMYGIPESVLLFRNGEGHQFNTVDLEAMGRVLCDVTLEYKNTLEDKS